MDECLLCGAPGRAPYCNEACKDLKDDDYQALLMSRSRYIPQPRARPHIHQRKDTPMRKWTTTVTVTNQNGDTGTATTPVCANDPQAATTGIANKLRDEGYTVDQVVVKEDGYCDHQQ